MTEPATPPEPAPPPAQPPAPQAPPPLPTTPATPRVNRNRRRVARLFTLAQSGFLLSAVLALINVFYAIQGSTIVVQPTEQVILYRDGNGDKAVLSMAVRLAMINTTTAAGDVLMKARLTALKGGPSFAYAATVKPVFTRDTAAAVQCELGARCIVLPGLIAIEHSDEIIDLPGGAVRSVYFTHPMAEWNCEGGDRACAAFTNFPAAVRALAGKPLAVNVHIEFYSDGHRDLTCTTNAVNAKYLVEKGWITLSCQTASVRGAPWF